MIYFITNAPDKLLSNYDNDIVILRDTEESTFELFKNFVDRNLELIGHDDETNGLDEWVNDLLYLTFGNEENQYILHHPYCSTGKYLKYIKDSNVTLLGANIKFDLKMAYTKENIMFTKVYDVMIAEQRCFQKFGISVSLENMLVRHLDIYPREMDKSIREEFINCDVATFITEEKHLRYSAGDVKYLFLIKKVQEYYIEKYELKNLLYTIEFPLIHIIAKAEATGFDFDTKKWKEVYEENVKELFNTECKLDKEFRELRDSREAFANLDTIRIKGGKYDNIRKHNPQYDVFNEDGTTNNLDLFGNSMSINTYRGSKAKKIPKIDKYPNNINYKSSDQVIKIFAGLGEPLLNKKEILIQPRFDKKGKLDKSIHSFMTNHDALTIYKSMLPESPMLDFIELLLKQRGLSKAVSTYGMNFINNLNPITNKIHTIFGQCFTDTGRMSSGGGDTQPDRPNFQNIPAKADYAIKMRNCFKAKEGYSIGTHDLSGAELIIMCDLSQDMKLLKIAKEDIHSYVAQGCWRAIYRYRAMQLSKEIQTSNKNTKADYDRLNSLLKLSETYIVDKTKAKIRTAFKPMTFGTIYGMYAGKAAKTLNITKQEGQIVIDFIKREFPDVFRMVEAVSKFVTENGYTIISERTKSRAWFPNIIAVLRGQLNPDDNFRVISKEQSEARNIKIQGTQADMIKECTVELQKWIDDNGYTDDITILSWVHDEIVDEHPKWMDGKSYSWQLWQDNYQRAFLIYNQNAYSNFPELKAQLMRDVCNRYLKTVKMDVGYEVEDYWTK